MKLLEQYIPLAIDVVEDLFLKDDSKVNPEYDNLASRFGVAVRQLGLKTAVIAFSPKSEGTNDKKSMDGKIMITKAIIRVIQLHENGTCREDESLLQFISVYPVNRLLKLKILDAAVAVKLALRLYIENPKEKEETKDDYSKETR